jgi:hypothetical protein
VAEIGKGNVCIRAPGKDVGEDFPSLAHGWSIASLSAVAIVKVGERKAIATRALPTPRGGIFPFTFRAFPTMHSPTCRKP